MSFSQEVKNEIRNKNFTSKRRNSKITSVDSDDLKQKLGSLFLACGSISDPGKCYLLEYVFSTKEEAEETAELISFFGITPKLSERKNMFILYIQDADDVSDMLSILGAHKALMEYENTRIFKEMRGNVQRQVNCETANLQKTVNAAVRQIEDIEYIEQELGFDKLPGQLREIAEVRLAMPNATLSELSEMLVPPVGRSGVNHRLRKLSKIAAGLKAKHERYSNDQTDGNSENSAGN